MNRHEYLDNPGPLLISLAVVDNSWWMTEKELC